MGDERAETYLRRVAEAELRRVGRELRRLEAGPNGPGQEVFVVVSRAQWKVVRTGRILVAAGALDRDFLHRLASEFHVAVNLRSRFLLNRDRRRGVLVHTMAEPPPPAPPAAPAPVEMLTTPVGRVLRVRDGRAIDGARFALAGLSMADGESHLHVIGRGRLPEPADRYADNWTPGFSWWLRDSAGNWHVATPPSNHGRSGTVCSPSSCA